MDLDLDKRISVVLKYLMSGGEVEIQGTTYVWLHNKVVKEDKDNLYVIDGLAIVGRSYSGLDDKEGEVCYSGQSDMPLSRFINLVYSIKDKTLDEIVMNIALTEFRQSKTR
ncbi:hypothetical protein MZM54_03055 [[Brevibacterium] frigoritolerans]|nr:hypothetical protein [Peribacillus frigoritolerans]